MNRAQNAREEILSRIKSALQDVPANEQPAEVTLERSYLQSGTTEREEVIERFIERVTDYKVHVQRIEARELARAIATACTDRAIRSLVVPTDLPADWLPTQVELLHDDVPLSNKQLDDSSGVLTGCALGIAQTGTIVLDGGAMQGRRVLTLLPDYHLCIIREEQIVELVPEAIMRLEDAVKQHGRPITFISGPSATSDIELNRVEGVHGPRTLDVLVVR
ncbi:MAG TPA: lactate utilization protein C [Ktedonobacteraceae bacterium]|jgi:L-lactate dehydrogenase complex protein LldG|nr:lactate utilization protein C [Ktedonobacteraceae bacterium]